MALVSEAKRHGELHKLWVELEWRRCATDKAYFFEKYVFIPSEQDARGRTEFQLFDYQRELLELMTKNRFVIALKARQLGYTTLAMAEALWVSLFRPGSTVLIVSRNQKSANKNLGQARLAWQFLPTWMQERAPKLINDSNDGMTFQFEDGMTSKMKSSPATEGTFAGETATRVILDEYALVEPAAKQDDVLRTLLPTTDAGGSMVIISTSRGNHNRFAKLYRLAKAGESQFVSFFQPWFVSPFMQCNKECGWCTGKQGESKGCHMRYDLKRREFSDNPWLFSAEYPADDDEAFRESGRPRFQNLPAIDSFQDFPYRGNLQWTSDTEMTFEFDEQGPLRLATLEPDPELNYVIGGDPSSGIGQDYSTAHLMTINDDGMPVILGYYHANDVAPTQYAADLDKLGRFFAGRSWAALMAIENQGGHGSLPINELHVHLDYPNPYMYQTVGSKSKQRTRMFEFPMTADRRRSVIDRLAKYLVPIDGDTQIEGIYPLLRNELGQFVARETANGSVKYLADVGCHDDLVMSLAIGLWVLIEEVGEASPTPATTETIAWVPRNRFDLTSIREARNKAIAELERQQEERAEAFYLGAQMLGWDD